MLVHNLVDLTSRHAKRSRRIFFAGRRGGHFGLRFNLSPRARCALRLGEAPRAFGFSILRSCYSYSCSCSCSKTKSSRPLFQSKSKRTSKRLRASMSCSLARPLSSAKFSGCFQKRSSCAVISSTRSSCQKCWIRF